MMVADKSYLHNTKYKQPVIAPRRNLNRIVHEIYKCILQSHLLLMGSLWRSVAGYRM